MLMRNGSKTTVRAFAADDRWFVRSSFRRHPPRQDGRMQVIFLCSSGRRKLYLTIPTPLPGLDSFPYQTGGLRHRLISVTPPYDAAGVAGVSPTSQLDGGLG